MRKMYPPRSNNLFLFFTILFSSCSSKSGTEIGKTFTDPQTPPSFIKEIKMPAGYTRKPFANKSFGAWLRLLPLTKDNIIYLYTGNPKQDQSLHTAVIDIPVGNKDLQQCADAVMHLRAEYLLANNKKDSVVFWDNNKQPYRYKGHGDKTGWNNYLDKVFGMCGTCSLQQQMHLIRVKEVQPGDVLVKGGFPGHAMMIVDMIENANGHKLVLLAQGYMPAQSIHIVKNLYDKKNDPWYDLEAADMIYTPGFTFSPMQLRRW